MAQMLPAAASPTRQPAQHSHSRAVTDAPPFATSCPRHPQPTDTALPNDRLWLRSRPSATPPGGRMHRRWRRRRWKWRQAPHGQSPAAVPLARIGCCCCAQNPRGKPPLGGERQSMGSLICCSVSHRSRRTDDGPVLRVCGNGRAIFAAGGPPHARLLRAASLFQHANTQRLVSQKVAAAYAALTTVRRRQTGGLADRAAACAAHSQSCARPFPRPFARIRTRVGTVERRELLMVDF